MFDNNETLQVSRLELLYVLKQDTVKNIRNIKNKVISYIVDKFCLEKSENIIKTIERQLSSKYLNRVVEKINTYSIHKRNYDTFESREVVWLQGFFQFVLSSTKIGQCNKHGKYEMATMNLSFNLKLLHEKPKLF